jgi:hypothetical protein
VKLFAGLEADGFAGGDGDFRASPRVASDAGFAWLDGEDAEAAQFNAIAGDQVLFHAIEDGVDGSLSFGPREAGTFNNPLYKILFNHLGPPSLGCNFLSTHLLTGFSNVMVESHREIVNVRTLP